MSFIELKDFMIHQLVNKRTEILPLATSHKAIHATSLIVFALPIPMPSFKSTGINFDQNRPKIKLFLQKIFERWELRPHTPEIAPEPLRISSYELDAEHAMRLALSDVEPRFQKLLKRNGNECLRKLLFFFGL